MHFFSSSLSQNCDEIPPKKGSNVFFSIMCSSQGREFTWKTEENVVTSAFL